jgi:hypothetical protein
VFGETLRCDHIGELSAPESAGGELGLRGFAAAVTSNVNPAPLLPPGPLTATRKVWLPTARPVRFAELELQASGVESSSHDVAVTDPLSL